MLATTRIHSGLLGGAFRGVPLTAVVVPLAFCRWNSGHGLIQPGHRMFLAFFVVDSEGLLYFPVILEAHQLAGWPFARVDRLALLAE